MAKAKKKTPTKETTAPPTEEGLGINVAEEAIEDIEVEVIDGDGYLVLKGAVFANRRLYEAGQTVLLDDKTANILINAGKVKKIGR